MREHVQLLPAKYPSYCRSCRTPVRPGQHIAWDPDRVCGDRVQCLTCFNRRIVASAPPSCECTCARCHPERRWPDRW